MKDYSNMKEAERVEWLERFGKFIAEDYANVKAMGDGWQEAFKRGLNVLAQFTASERFVRDSRQYMDYERRVKRMCYFIEELRREVVEEEGDVLARAASPQYSRRRGRPSAESLAEERKVLAQQENDAKKIDVLAVLSGQRVEAKVKGQRLKDEVVKTGGNGGLDLFSQGEPASTPTSEPASASYTEPASTPHTEPKLQLRDLKHLLSADLAEAVDNVALLRGQAATESEMAKQLAMGGGSRKDIAEHSAAATKYTNAYMDIFKKVDDELALLYVKTRLDAGAVVQGETRESQLVKCEPYYHKAVEADPAFEGKALLKLQKANEAEVLSPEGKPMSKADKAALLHKYRTFFLRKGVKATKERVAKMEKTIEYLKSIGETCEEYEHILAETQKKLKS